MSKLRSILEQAKAGLQPWEPIPQAQWPAIAAACGPAEFQEIEVRVQSLMQELADTPDWDGDTQDDINRTMWFFNSLLALRPV